MHCLSITEHLLLLLRDHDFLERGWDRLDHLIGFVLVFLDEGVEILWSPELHFSDTLDLLYCDFY